MINAMERSSLQVVDHVALGCRAEAFDVVSYVPMIGFSRAAHITSIVDAFICGTEGPRI